MVRTFKNEGRVQRPCASRCQRRTDRCQPCRSSLQVPWHMLEYRERLDISSSARPGGGARQASANRCLRAGLKGKERLPRNRGERGAETLDAISALYAWVQTTASQLCEQRQPQLQSAISCDSQHIPPGAQSRICKSALSGAGTVGCLKATLRAAAAADVAPPSAPSS